MGKCGTARQATVDSVKQSMHFACWITKATNTHSEYVIQASLIVHHGYFPEKVAKIEHRIPI